MRYILMMNVGRGSGEYQSGDWTPEQFKIHMAHMVRLNDDLAAAGELVDVEGLEAPGGTRLVRADGAGAPEVTDGPFPESKEFLAGYWIVDVATPERAYEIAARASAAPGPDGKPLNQPIELRKATDLRSYRA
jgi:hypothetical protein